MAQACAVEKRFHYKRHEPEKTLLYATLAREWETWLEQRNADTSRSPLPAYVNREMDAFFRCGVLDHGFVLVSCDACGENLPVAFSCKRRGFCPSCCAKRMSEISTHLVDNVLPHAPYRQWVTTFPYALRYWMAASRELTNVVHQWVTHMLTIYYTNKAEERGIKEPRAGGVTFIQRFGSALNLNIHFHTVMLDGVYSVAGATPVFYHLPGPTDEEVSGIVEALATAVIDDMRKRDYLPAEGSVEAPAWLDDAFRNSEQLQAAVGASATMRIAFGARAGQEVRRIGHGFGYEDEVALVKGPRCYSVNGFTIHANRFIGQQERTKLEELLAYGARGSFSHQRLSLADPEDPTGDLVYTLKTRWRDGTEAIQMSASETIEKLVALIPPPNTHTSRYFGVLSSHSKYRRQIVLAPLVKKGFVLGADGTSVLRMTWARLLKRTFELDLERCRACGARVYPENFVVVDQSFIIAATLRMLGIFTSAPARAPPRSALFDTDCDQSRPELDSDYDQSTPYAD